MTDKYHRISLPKFIITKTSKEKLMKNSIIIFLIGFLLSAYSFATEPDTSVVFSLEKCTQKNLDNWQHPTRKVLDDAGANIKAVYLCNKTYPVFVANFPYDPLGDTGSFFNTFYYDLLQANAKWPYSIISEDTDVIHIKPEGTGFALDYDELKDEDAIWLLNSKTQAQETNLK